MYKIFIVDDNPYMLDEIKELIDWENLGIELAGSYKNGYEALTAIEKDPPDIVLTDIEMPRLNGIDLAMRLRDCHPYIKVVFMSSYNEFTYAQKAIDIGIYGYVIKPVAPEPLRKALHKLLEDYEKERFHQAEKQKMQQQMELLLPIMQEQVCRELILHEVDESLIKNRLEYGRISVPDGACIHAMSITVRLLGGAHYTSAHDALLTSLKIRDIIRNSGRDGQITHAVQMGEREYAVLFFDTGKAAANATTLAAQFSIDINRILGLSLTVGISKAAQSLADIPALYLQAREAVKSVFNEGNNTIVRYEEIEAGDEDDTDISTDIGRGNIYEIIKELIMIGDEADTSSFIDRVICVERMSRRQVKNKSFSILNAAAFVMMELGHSFSDLFGDSVSIWEKLSRFDSIVDIRQWLMNILLCIREYLHTNRAIERKYGRYVEAIKDYVHKHYHEQITVQIIARAIFLSAGYADRCFRKETGMTIFNYLHLHRMKVAKELLLDDANRVADVAEKVGFISKTHFCLSFKTATGMTPTEYRGKAVPS